ncbi:hypothetical protein BB558_001835 [Smittium angustum]|uniref:UBA domain-containing protein n=1 Tax=Smittium angustum TaxID=133377 RepID=A0A2U1JAI9_SMIAN|nr:hypothetical protein BB558_001835 [Smittium angustum]
MNRDDSIAVDDPNNYSRAIKINVCLQNSKPQIVEIERDKTILDLKSLLEPLFNYPIRRIRLVFGRQILKDELSIREYGILDNSEVKLIVLADNEESSTSSSRSVQKQASPQNEMLLQASKNPLFKELLKSPELMQNILKLNPQFKQLMKKNPEFQNVFQDPGFMDQFFSAAQNPEVMKEMMRNNDRAISNLEMQPGGFNYLTQMYNNVQKPMENSAMENQKITRATNERLARALNTTEPPKDKINITPLPNPWGAKPQPSPFLPRFSKPLNKPSIDNPSSSNNPGDFNKSSTPFPRSAFSDHLDFFSPRISNISSSRKDNNDASTSTDLSKPRNEIGPQLTENTKNLSKMTISSPGSQNGDLSSPTSSRNVLPDNSDDQPDIRMSDDSDQDYESKAQLLVEMGFTNKDKNMQALQITNGDVSSAIDWLVENL